MNDEMNGAAQTPIEPQLQGAVNCDPNVWRAISELHRLASTGIMCGIAVVAVMRDGNAAKMCYLPPDARLMSMVSGQMLSLSVQTAMNAEQLMQQKNVSPILRPPGIMGG
jgi:BarA-like signal transduction histidine kinase